MSLAISLSEQSIEVDLVAHFRRLTDDIARFGRLAKVQITPYRDASLPLFRALSEERQRQVIFGLNDFAEICQSTLDEGHDLDNSPQLLWSALRRMGLRPPSDLFDSLSSEDIIEIHCNGQQLFRNFRYFEYCSYTLEELSSIDWTQLYRRPAGIEKEIFEELKRARDAKGVIFTKLQEHIVEESFAPLKLKIGHHLRMVAPLFSKTPGLEYILGSVRAELKESAPSESEEERLLTQYYGKQML